MFLSSVKPMCHKPDGEISSYPVGASATLVRWPKLLRMLNNSTLSFRLSR